MPIAAPRGVTSDSLSGLFPVPMGITEELGGSGLLELIKRLVSNPEEIAEKINTGFSQGRFAKDLIQDATTDIRLRKLATEPGVNVFPYGIGNAKKLVYMGPSGEVIGTATVNEFPHLPGKFYTGEFAVDKSRGLLAGKAATALGKKLLEMGAANLNPKGAISSDTYKLLQHLSKLVK